MAHTGICRFFTFPICTWDTQRETQTEREREKCFFIFSPSPSPSRCTNTNEHKSSLRLDAYTIEKEREL